MVSATALAALVADVGALFGGPQDVEFLFEPDGTLRLLQSRPVTTEVRGPPIGPVYGPGPVAETFPDPLGPLEVSLWVDPLREGLREALRLSALAGERDLGRRPLVVVAGGRVAMDLELVGALPHPSAMDAARPPRPGPPGVGHVAGRAPARRAAVARP